MFNLLIRIILVVAGFIASWFVARDALNFPIFQMIISVFIITLVVAILAFWPWIKNWLSK